MWFFNNKPPLHLPKPEGKYQTGCMDVMLEYSESGIFATLFYPTDAVPEEKTYTKWIPWFPDNDYLIGMARAIFVLPLALRLVKWWYSAGNKYIPSSYGEKITQTGKLKLIMMSHGYAAFRFLYSVICNELASRGYLVAVIEHRDHSASFTYYYKSKEDAQRNIRTPIHVKQLKFGHGHYENRNKQVHKRSEECSKLLDFFINLNKGVVPYNIVNDTESGTNVDFKLEDLVGRLDTDDVTMVGHSFGGATALLTLSKRKELKQGIILDAWMFPVKDENNLIENVTQPLLFINTQTFHILPNINLMDKFLKRDNRNMFTILHTTHESQTDSVCVMGYWLNWFMRKLEPVQALKINNALMLKFLKQHTGHSESIEDCEKYLKEQDKNVTHGLTKPWA